MLCAIECTVILIHYYFTDSTLSCLFVVIVCREPVTTTYIAWKDEILAIIMNLNIGRLGVFSQQLGILTQGDELFLAEIRLKTSMLSGFATFFVNDTTLRPCAGLMKPFAPYYYNKAELSN